jgi:hypothetical protein
MLFRTNLKSIFVLWKSEKQKVSMKRSTFLKLILIKTLLKAL